MRFFIPDLLESVTGQSGRGPFSPFHSQTVSSDAAAGFPAEFKGNGQPWHLCLNAPLTDACAERIAGGELRPRFTQWLESKAGAGFHRQWAGWPAPGAKLKTARVEVERAVEGDEGPVQVDTEGDGLSVIYLFGRGFTPGGGGGALFFPKRRGSGNRLLIEPLFNRALLFRARAAPYGMARIEQPGASLDLISAFYRFKTR